MSRFLRRYAGTLAPLVAAAGAVVVAWELLPARGVVAVGVALAAWVTAAALWLRCRGWRRRHVHQVTWAVPVVLLGTAAAAGWLSTDGLVLWFPLVTVLAVSVGLQRHGIPTARG